MSPSLRPRRFAWTKATRARSSIVRGAGSSAKSRFRIRVSESIRIRADDLSAIPRRKGLVDAKCHSGNERIIIIASLHPRGRAGGRIERTTLDRVLDEFDRAIRK